MNSGQKLNGRIYNKPDLKIDGNKCGTRQITLALRLPHVSQFLFFANDLALLVENCCHGPILLPLLYVFTPF